MASVTNEMNNMNRLEYLAVSDFMYNNSHFFK